MGVSSAASLQQENLNSGRVASACHWGMGMPGPARYRQRSKRVASTSSLFCVAAKGGHFEQSL